VHESAYLNVIGGKHMLLMLNNLEKRVSSCLLNPIKSDLQV
jgi:hypothetical protein